MSPARPSRSCASTPPCGGQGPGPLSGEQLAAYESSGYLVLDNLLSADEVETYRAELQRLGQDPVLRASERVVPEPDSDRVRSVFEVEKVSEVFAGLLFSSKLTDIARQVLDSDVYIHQSRVNYKPGFGGAEFDWHPTSRPGTPRTACPGRARSACRSR